MDFSAQINLTNRVSFLEKLLFTKHLAVMIKSGIILSEALETLIEQTKSSVFKKVLTSVLKDIENGQTLGKALEKHPQVFDQFYISMIEVGEEAGRLEENLDFLAKQLSKDYTLRKKIQSAMFYPLLVFIATFTMGGFISLFVLPKLVDFFASFRVELPLTTKILLFVANLMKYHGILIFICMGIFLMSFMALIQIKDIKRVWHRIILHLPLFGQILAYNQLARFSRNLGTLLQSGVPIVNSLETTGKTLSNLTFSEAMIKVKDDVKKGKTLADALDNFRQQLFPPIVIKMVAVGEKSGKLEETLLYLGDFYDDEIDNITKNLSTILEPILLIIIGIIVGFVALAVISPIYELTGSIRR